MLNKKSAFKPKAAVRRPPPGSASQNSQRPSTTEYSSSNTPAPQESSSPQPQPAPHPGPSTPLDIDRPVSGNEIPQDGRASAQAQDKQSALPEAEPTPQRSTTLTPTATVREAGGERAATSAPTETRHRGPVAVQVGKPGLQETPTVSEPVISGTRTAGTEVRADSSADSRSKRARGTTAGTSFADSAISHTEIPSSTLAPNNSTAAPALTQIETASAVPEDQVLQNQPAQATAAPAENVATRLGQPATEATFEPTQGASQTAKPKRGRKRTTATTPAEDPDEQSTAAPPKKRPRKRAAPLPGEEGYQPAAPRATRSRKRPESAAEDENVEADGEENTEQPKKRPPRTQRQATPPDAEHVEIDITQVKMADLAKDMHIGKKFSLHDELMERERAKRLRYNEKRKRQQAGEDGDDTAANGEASAGSPSSNPNAATSTQATPAATDSAAAETPADNESNSNAPIGEMYQVINGQIVLDHRSLQVDRHARAREEAGELVEVEENDFTHHTTSATYLRRNLKPQQWTDEETELFYQALQAFGTDFDTIYRMFKGKTRKHIKLKFNREERVNPQRINAALVGQKTVSIDMEQYQRATGQEYETAEAIYAEQKRAEEEFEAKQKALEDEKAEEVRRKKDEVLAQLNDAMDGQNGSGNGGNGARGGKRGRRKKKGLSN